MTIHAPFRPPRVHGLACVLALVATRAVPAAGSGQADPTLRAADSVVAAWVAAERVPGAVLVVSRHGRTVLERAYGWAQLHDQGAGQYGAWLRPDATPRDAPRRLPDPRPMTTGTVFDLASVTKVMATTFAAMLLVDEGALDLDAPVSRYLGDFTGGGKDAITVRHLLTHRAGLAQWQPLYYHAAGASEAYRTIRDMPLSWPVSSGRHYSDLGFMLLGRVVERVSGRPLPALLHERLYAPLGLTRTGFRPRSGGAPPAEASVYAATSHGNPYEYRMVHDSTFGYRYDGDPAAWDGWRRRTLVGEVNDGNAFHAFGGVAGHAGLFSTAGELRALVQLLLDRGEAEGHRYLSPEVVGEFLAPTGDGQALGWQLPDWAPPGSFAHTGFTGTLVLGVPSLDLAVVLLTNRQNVGVDRAGTYPDVGPLQRAVVASLTGNP